MSLWDYSSSEENKPKFIVGEEKEWEESTILLIHSLGKILRAFFYYNLSTNM